MADILATTHAGETAGARITSASKEQSLKSGWVVVPPSMAVDRANPPPTTDIVIPPEVTVLDLRNQVGTVTNRAQKGSAQWLRLFGDNMAPVELNSDNGAVLAAEALLTGGTGSNGTNGQPIHGENVAVYAGIQRQPGSTRSMWGINVVATSYEPAETGFSTYGVEVDLSNNGGLHATSDTPFDGVAIFAAGSHNPRFGLWVTNSGSAQWLKGIMVSNQVSDVGIEVSSGIPIGILTQSPLKVDSTVTLNNAGNADTCAFGPDGAHRFYIDDGGQKIAEFDANARLTLFKSRPGDPSIEAAGPVDDINISIVPKGTGTVDVHGPTTEESPTHGSAQTLPATPAGYLEIRVNGTPRKVAYY